MSPPLPWLGAMRIVARVSGLTLVGGVKGGVLSQVTLAATVTAALTVTTQGTTTIAGTATVLPLVDTPFRIESSTGGSLAATLSNSGLTFSGARLRVDGIFSTTVALPAFTIPATGDFTLAVSPPNLSIAGIPCASISFTFDLW